ncbi:AAA family ATPase [Amycolatopsis sp. NPDC024027]|uniref:AAA family ATPase n=1 Tax=Amycolatopsis sp. NPDC024027 TaxID=3154327 RepID=UPI0033CDC5F1
MFESGIFTPEVLGDERTANVLLAAVDAASIVHPSDFLHAAITSGDPKIFSALSTALADGARPAHILKIIDVYHPREPSPHFDGKRERFSADALDILDEFAAEFAKDRELLRESTLELFVATVLSHLDEDDRKHLTILDAEAAVKALRAGLGTDPPAPLFDSASGRLRSEEFTESAWATLERAAAEATALGYDLVLPPHCLLALLGETEGLAERLVRLQAPPDVGPARVAAAVADAFRLAGGKQGRLGLRRADLGETLTALLRVAQRTARVWGAARIDTPHLLSAVLHDPPARLVSVLEREPARLDLAGLRAHVEKALRDGRGDTPHDLPLRLPADLLPAEDLTWRARAGELRPAPHLDGYFDALARGLYRRTDNHVLVTGPRGVGTTTLVGELARRATAGDIPFLARKRFLRVDCRVVSPEESGAKLAELIGFVSGRTDVVLCLDGLGPLLRAGSDGNHKLTLLSALKERRVHLIGVLDTADYEDLLAGDHALLELFTRVEMTEPGRDAALDIAARIAAGLAEDFGFDIEDKAVERAVVLSADYILCERLPAKAAKVLRLACEDLDYERTQLGSERTVVGPDGVVAVVSRLSGLPARQLSGLGSEVVDFDYALGEVVVGQDEAVASVATELRLIKAGLRPGSVLFFAGLTGVGKTELAKALARFYSASKRLRTYTMGNFTEGHMVSGITGVAPGYVGHERGGRLVNDLNTDPHCVFLLDEAEKAHPDIWKPFLTLFDEGWIEDQRGVRAFGDRAIFILTSNAGAEIIAELSARGLPMPEIASAVKEHLPTLQRKVTREPVFPPEFLARIRKIIVFKPLDEAAMAGICRKQLEQRTRFWADKREKELVVPDELVAHIARLSHAENTASGGREGGRIVDKKIADLVDEAVVREAELQPEAYRACHRIELTFAAPGPRLPGGPRPAARVSVVFGAPAGTGDARS